MDVVFETSKGRQFAIEVGFFDTVLEMKEKIQKYEGFPVAQQTLVFKDQVGNTENESYPIGLTKKERFLAMMYTYFLCVPSL